MAPMPQTLKGTVVEKIDTAAYSYLKLKTDMDKQVWAAVMKTEVKSGTNVVLYRPMLMRNFSSKTLKRTFEQIYFATLTPPGRGGRPAPGAQAAGAPQAAKSLSGHGGSSAKKVAAPISQPKGSLSVADLYLQRHKLAGKTVSVRGQVVKFSKNIMGRNWVHLQDGSGEVTKKNFDLALTSQKEFKVGEVVTVQGLVAADKNIGAGYSFAVLLEKAEPAK
ncbi:MAG: nucleotide-binding protein [Deltaproteobacteria bacterium]|nr:nucleotide-binding protein [Deltaproteobacteria bacterium]